MLSDLNTNLPKLEQHFVSYIQYKQIHLSFISIINAFDIFHNRPAIQTVGGRGVVTRHTSLAWGEKRGEVLEMYHKERRCAGQVGQDQAVWSSQPGIINI